MLWIFSTLIDVDCFFISSYEEINYQLHYYHMDPQLLTNVSQDWNGFYKLLKSASTSGGNLKPHTSIVVIGTYPQYHLRQTFELIYSIIS